MGCGPRLTDLDDGDDFDDREYPDEPDDDADVGDDDLEICRSCGHWIAEDSSQCPYCGEFVTRTAPLDIGKRWWVLLGVIACLYGIYQWTVQ